MFRRTQLLFFNLIKDIGSCGYCMRQSFLFMSLVSIFSCIAWFGCYKSELVYGGDICAVAAISSASLWLAHILTFSVRTTKSFIREKTETNRSRRMVFKRFGHALATAVVVTAIPKSAFAGNICAGREYGSCGGGDICCKCWGGSYNLYYCCTDSCSPGNCTCG